MHASAGASHSSEERERVWAMAKDMQGHIQVQTGSTQLVDFLKMSDIWYKALPTTNYPPTAVISSWGVVPMPEGGKFPRGLQVLDADLVLNVNGLAYPILQTWTHLGKLKLALLGPVPRFRREDLLALGNGTQRRL